MAAFQELSRSVASPRSRLSCPGLSAHRRLRVRLPRVRLVCPSLVVLFALLVRLVPLNQLIRACQPVGSSRSRSTALG